MRRIRVLFVVNGFSIGGGELKLLELVKEIKEKYSGHFHCTVCSVGIDGPLRSRFESLGVRTEVFLKSYPYDISQVLKLVRLIREEKTDIVQTTLFYADVIGTYASMLAGVNHVISWEAVTQPYQLKHLLAYRLASKWFTVSVAVSHAIQRQVMTERHVSAHKTCTIHYGVDIKRFYPGKDSSYLYRELKLSKRDVLIGTVARLTEQKGHRYLIEAIPGILHAHPDAHFIFIGDGPLRDELSRQAESLGVRKSIHFLGFRKDIPRLLLNLDLFILPSLYEGLPNAVLEAMACGLPVVATSVDGTPEAIVHQETGLLIPPRQSQALIGAVISLLNDRHRMNKMGKAGRKRIETCFSVDNQVSKFIQLYDSLFSQGG
ncbi:glycosyltransferase [bacterium]|nr:glycosyltransferase [bacterium]